MSRVALSAAIPFLLFCLIVSSLPGLAAIYGEDSRRDAALAPSEIRKFQSGMAVLVSKQFILREPETASYQLDLRPIHQEGYQLCTDQRFQHQPTASPSCTGFLIGDDLLLTAGHCMVNHGRVERTRTAFCEDFVWLFDYSANSDGQINLGNRTQQEIAECAEVIEAVFEVSVDPISRRPTFGEDYAIIRLQRKLPERARFELNTNFRPDAQPLYALGYPLGLPLKFAWGRFLKILEDGKIRTNIDIQEGNSGSPVFGRDGKVVGIHVNGYAPDSIWQESRQCAVMNLCNEAASSCQSPPRYYDPGEILFPISHVAKRLEQLGINR